MRPSPSLSNPPDQDDPPFLSRRGGLVGKILGGLSVLGIIVVFLLAGKIWEHVDAGEVVVIQYPNGNLNIVTEPGIALQLFGTVEHFHRSNQFDFTKDNSAIRTRFNDGAHGSIYGSIRYDFPTNPAQIKDLYKTYRTEPAIRDQLVSQNMQKSVYMTGPLMSSKESYSDRRTELINDIEDQAKFGVFQTRPVDKEIDDPITLQKKWIRAVEMKKDEKTGMILRQEPSPLERFGIPLYNLAIGEIRYDEAVEKQIGAQQQAIMQVQTAMAKSKEAEQEALTAAKQGEALAVKAKYEQEVIKAKEVTKAEQEAAVAKTNAERDKLVAETAAKRDKIVAETAAEQQKNVADFARQAAEFTKAQEIALGEGEAKRKELAMRANGALEQRLAAIQSIHQVWATAYQNFRGQIVPNAVFGGSGGGTNMAENNPFNNAMNALTVKLVRELGVDLNSSNHVTKTGSVETEEQPGKQVASSGH